jgi:recombination protein RecA
MGVKHGVLTRAGSWFKYGDTYLGQGKEKARAFLAENMDVVEEIKPLIFAAAGYGLDDELEPTPPPQETEPNS